MSFFLFFFFLSLLFFLSNIIILLLFFLLNKGEEAGWKLVHGHVFRPPQPLVLFCSMIGVGAQFFAMIMSVLTLALLGIFSPMRRGGVATAAVLL